MASRSGDRTIRPRTAMTTSVPRLIARRERRASIGDGLFWDDPFAETAVSVTSLPLRPQLPPSRAPTRGDSRALALCVSYAQRLPLRQDRASGYTTRWRSLRFEPRR